MEVTWFYGTKGTKWAKGDPATSTQIVFMRNIALVGFQFLPNGHLSGPLKKEITDLMKPFQAKYLARMNGDDSDSDSEEADN